MVYLACMIIGSMVTIVSACLCAVGKDDKPKTVYIHSGYFLYEFDKTTGEVLNFYEYTEGDKYGDIYEKRELK